MHQIVVLSSSLPRLALHFDINKTMVRSKLIAQCIVVTCDCDVQIMIDTGMGTPLRHVLSSVLADSACGAVTRPKAGPNEVTKPHWTWDGKRPVWNDCPRGRAVREEVKPPTKCRPSARRDASTVYDPSNTIR